MTRRSLHARVEALEAATRPGYFIMGAALLDDDGELLGLTSFPRGDCESTNEQIRHWGKDAGPGWLWIGVHHHSEYPPDSKIVPASEIGPEALKELQPHLEARGTLYRQR